MSNPNANPRKRAAPGHLPLPSAQRLPQSYAAPNAAGDQMIKWDGIDGLAGFVDGGANGNNGYELVQSQPQYSQNASGASNSLTRRPMNQALVPTRPRSNFDTSMGWDGLVDNTSLVAHGQDDAAVAQDSLSTLEELAQQAKRDAQAKRKQIPPFVQKLSSFLEEGKNEDLIRWSQNGDSFIVLDEDEFAKTLIPELFKHNNYASFVRQLNMYGFHKRVGLSDNSMRASERKNKSPSEYSNPYFRRGHPNLLWLINKSKGGGKGKKAKANDADADSDEDAVVDEASSQVPGVSSGGAQAARSLPPADNQTVSRKEMNHVREELVRMRDQQKLIKQHLSRLQQTNNNLYNEALMFRDQHDRHQNSINAILSFLANLFRKSLEDQGNSQSVGDIIQTFIANQGQTGSHQGSVVDLGDFFQNGVDAASSLGGPPHKRARGLLPPIPTQDSTGDSHTSGRGSFGHMNNSNPEMGHITELGDGSPAETPPNIRQELETNPQEQMMRIINDHNATNPSGMDLPGAAEFVASAPSLNQDQRNKLANLMARQSKSPASSTSNVPSPSMSRPASHNQAAPQARQPRPKQPQAAPPAAAAAPAAAPAEASAAPSLSPLMRSPAMDPLSMNQINHSQAELDQLQRLQNQQDQKINELNDLLGPLSPSGRVPAFDEAGVDFDPNTMDFDQYFNFNDTLDDPTFGGVGDDFPTDFDATTGTGLDTGQPLMNEGGDEPSPADTEEIAREDFGVNDGADRGSKRRRVT